MRAAKITRILLALALTSLLAPHAGGQQSSRRGFWKGKFEIFQFNLLHGSGHNVLEKTDYVYRTMELWRYNYDLYQNPEGIAREELTYMNRNRFAEPPMDVKLLDYEQGEGIIFDKGGSHAVRGPLGPPVSGKALGQRVILGFACEGTEYQWKTFQQSTVRLESWRAKDSSFKVPLLQVQYFTDNTGALLALTVRVVNRLEPVPELPPSLFIQPPGLKVDRVPSIE